MTYSSYGYMYTNLSVVLTYTKTFIPVVVTKYDIHMDKL